MIKYLVLIGVCSTGLIMSLLLLFNCFVWPINIAEPVLIAQLVGMCLLLALAVWLLKRGTSWLLFCFVLGAALMLQINLLSWTYEHQHQFLQQKDAPPAASPQNAP